MKIHNPKQRQLLKTDFGQKRKRAAIHLLLI